MRSFFQLVSKFVLGFAVIVTCGIALIPQVAFGAQVPNGSLTVLGQESAVLLNWEPYPGAFGYYVWRSTDAEGARARIVGTAAAGGTGGSFADLTATIGGRYRYAVSVVLAAGEATAPGLSDWTLMPVSLAMSATATSPHLGADATKSSQSCIRCHSLTDFQQDNQADSPQALEYLVSDLGRDDKTLSGLCLMCHTSSAKEGISSVGVVFSEGVSGHSIETSLSIDASADNELHACSDCHNAHADSESGTSLRPKKVRLAGEERAVDGSDNGWCLACHANGSSDAALVSPDFDTSGYPVTGTFPGEAVYESAAANVHATINSTSTPSDVSRPPGDCLHCHAAHRSESPYDSLLVVGDAKTDALPNRSDGDIAPLCFSCHTEVACQPVSEESTATLGHMVTTSGGFYEAETALPCFVCHNPHGSKRGNALNISDALGQNLNPRGTSAEVTQFCFSCHTSTDGLGWDSVAATYTAVPSTATIVGLSRVETPMALVQSLTLRRTVAAFAAGIKGAPSRLRLSSIPHTSPTTDPHDRRYTGDKTCTDCHGSAHSPSIDPGDVSALSCYDCHSDLKPMDKSSVQKTATFHHILGSSETPFAGGTLLSGYSGPPSSQNKYSKYCLSCHTDHITNPGQSVLRTSTTDATPASSDFGGSGSSPGICISCHASAKSRSSVNQKGAFTRLTSSTEITSVPKIDPVLYAASRHNYDVRTVSGTNGNCIKCHNGAEAVGGSTLDDFSVHTSSNKSLISRVGDESDPLTWNSTPAQYKLCFQCHARIDEVATTSQIGKMFAGKDWYGAVSMGAAKTLVYKRGTTAVGARTYNDESVFSDMFNAKGSGIDLSQPISETRWAVSGHLAEKIVSPSDPMLKDPYRTSTTSVRCTDCHEVHKTSMGIMATGQEWPLTQKALVPSTSAFANKSNKVTSANAWAKLDGTGADLRLITLNDFWYRDEQLKAGKSAEWIAANTVTVFCFECHSESGMAGKSHAAVDAGPGTAGLNHKTGSLACVYCHVPAVHGSGMPSLLTDASTGILPEHQMMKWFDPFKTAGNANQPVAKLFAISSTTDFQSTKPTGCSTTNALDGGCHGSLPSGWRAQADATGTGWVNWVK